MLCQTEGTGRLPIESRSMSVVAVADAFAPVDSAGKDQGLLWALNHYWRILQKDGGLYVECEALVLSRPTPFMLGWIARPVIARAARESLIKTVRATRLMLRIERPEYRSLHCKYATEKLNCDAIQSRHKESLSSVMRHTPRSHRAR